MRKWHPNEDSDSELAQIVSEQKMLDDGFEDGIRAEMVESNWNDDILLVIKCVPRRAKIMRKIAIAAGVAALLCVGSVAVAEPAQVDYEEHDP